MTLDEAERQLRKIDERADIARGKLYRQIRGEHLYVDAGVKSFAAYCRSERCPYTQVHVYRLIKLADKANAAVTSADVPASIRAANPEQAFANTRVSPDLVSEIDEPDDEDDEPVRVRLAKDDANPRADITRAISFAGAAYAHVPWETLDRLPEDEDVLALAERCEGAATRFTELADALRAIYVLRQEVAAVVARGLGEEF